MKMSDKEPGDFLVAMAEVVLDAGVEQLKKADLATEDLRQVVGRIYAAMEITYIALEAEYELDQLIANDLFGAAPADKSKLN